MKCPDCEIENPSRANFCTGCGARLESICPNCGSDISPSHNFCSNCGHRVGLPPKTSPGEPSFDQKLTQLQRRLPSGLTEKILSERNRIEGELKHVTVMFCDLAGFTPLAEELGPEAAYSLMDQVYEILIHKIHSFGGTVNEFTGDGVIALFGAPIALEDAPQRAIRSALSIHLAMSGHEARIEAGNADLPPLKMRIGIHTGPVVVGMLGNDLRVEFKAVGDTVNLASRMERLAEPGTTYVTEDTFLLTEGMFHFEALGEHRVKGKSDSVKAYRVIAPSTCKTRFDVSAERGLTPFVGRQRELELLLECFDRVREGKGQVFSIVSEAGVGKSRLLHEFKKCVAEMDANFLEGRCLSYRRGATNYPIADILKSSFGIGEGEGQSSVKEKVRKNLQQIGLDEPSTLPFVLELLSVRESGIDEAVKSPEAMKEKITETFKRIAIEGARVRPLIIAVEDLHWIDRSSEDVLKEFFGSLSGERVFLILTYRPGFTPSWGSKSYHHQITLNRLLHRESLAMTRHILGAGKAHEDLERLILGKTEGVPFFIEEFIKSLRDLNIIEKRGERYVLSKDYTEVTIPSTIHDVVMVRVDALPKVSREILLMGSVVGRQFSYELIRRTMDLKEQELSRHLAHIKESELVYERGVHPQTTFVFKHALIQDICFHSILKRIRRGYHRKIVRAMHQHFPEIEKEHPEILGHHLTEAGRAEQAVPYWQKAGELAIRRSANSEAIEHLGKALELIEAMSDRARHLQAELVLQTTLGSALMAARGYSAPEVGKAYARALALSKQVGETPEHFTILRGLWGFYVVKDDLKTAQDLGNQCLDIATRTNRGAQMLWSNFMLGMTVLHFGEFNKALEYLEKGIALYDVRKRRSNRALQDPGVACLSYASLALCLLGYPDRALEKSGEAIGLARRLEHPFSLAYSMNIASIVCQLLQNVQSARDHAEAAIDLCTDQGIPYWLAYGPILRGWALFKEGEKDAGIRQTQQGLNAYSETGAVLGRTYFLSLLAEAHWNKKQARQGLTLLEEALSLAERSGERWVEAGLLRLKGELLLELDSDSSHEAEACFDQAIVTARHQNAKSLELRAVMSLSRLWRRQGKKARARERVEEVYGRFDEGLDTPLLKEAEHLLGSLA